jgi:hypothetical protein
MVWLLTSQDKSVAQGKIITLRAYPAWNLSNIVEYGQGLNNPVRIKFFA